MIEVIKSGPLLTVQDLGRMGVRHLGVTLAGALDRDALRVANRLVGNDDNCAGLEITLGMAKFKFKDDHVFAISGADMSANLDGKAIHVGWNYQAKAGQTLTFATSAHGLRSYLAVRGGIACESELNSRSTDLMAEIGPFKSPLDDGQVLEIAAASSCEFQSVGTSLPTRAKTIYYTQDPRLQLDQEQIHHNMAKTNWQVCPNSNRMGLRLQVEDSELSHSHSITSTAVHLGTIQLPPDGNPIVLLNDCQTTGGYPILGQVIDAHLSSLAQLRGNQSVRFKAVDLATAIELNKKHQAEFARFNLALQNA